jgi:hypothetical protein
LDDLLNTLKTVSPEKIQYFSDYDIISTWLDRKGYPELAETFRPIHGKGESLVNTLAESLENWMDANHNYHRAESHIETGVGRKKTRL